MNGLVAASTDVKEKRKEKEGKKGNTEEKEENTHTEEKSCPAWNESPYETFRVFGRGGDYDCSTTNKTT